MLFSEPKIPQIARASVKLRAAAVSVLFSEPKIPQTDLAIAKRDALVGFSALQRAENSSKQTRRRCVSLHTPFQCSSASRKFLKRDEVAAAVKAQSVFQCSSASRKFLKFENGISMQFRIASVSVLFSEPKIPQIGAKRLLQCFRVSVLFSEPKIPQMERSSAMRQAVKRCKLIAPWHAFASWG